jgi:hypothetical protein
MQSILSLFSFFLGCLQTLTVVEIANASSSAFSGTEDESRSTTQRVLQEIHCDFRSVSPRMRCMHVSVIVTGYLRSSGH